MEGKRWDEAADVADRVLNVDELKGWVDAQAPGPADPQGLRWLLARRLSRAGRLAEAVPYFPPDLLADVTAFRDAHAAVASARGPDQRAYALFQLAKIERARGLELLGTEHAPDGVSTGGQFEFPDVTGRRLAGPAGAGLGPDELARRAASAPSPARRWHYRYVAAEHAREAAALLPDDDGRTLAILCTAGKWLAPTDAGAADGFYKLLVTRGWNHALGRAADANRWFPADCGEPWPAGAPAAGSCASAPWPHRAAWWILAAWAVRRRRPQGADGWAT